MKPNYLVKTRRQAIARARRKFGLKDYEGALAEWEELQLRNHDDPLPWLGRFDCLMKLNRKQEMLAIGDKVCELFPESEAAHNNYACLLLEKREFGKACNHFDVALALAPERTMYYFNAGLAYRGAGQLNQAAVCFQHVLEGEPNHERALEFLSQIYLDFGLGEQALALSLRLRMLRPGYTLPLQRRLLVMMQDPAISEDELSMEVSLLRTALMPSRREDQADPRSPLRIGWLVCPWSLPFLRYVMPVLKDARDGDRFHLVAYCNQPQLDLSVIGDQFDSVHRIESGTTAALAELIQQHPVDVLVDTVGQVPNNLLQHYAKRLASCQVSWPFYHSQVEMILMDHAMVDQAMLPAKSRRPAAQPDTRTVTLTDRLVSFGSSQFFYDAASLPDSEATDSPQQRNGYVTFGVVANPIHINQASVDLWGRILAKVSDAKLAFHLGQLPAVILERQLVAYARESGIDPQRIEFVPRSDDFSQRLDAFKQIDILLSPWPVTDDLALIDSMIAGCPVVALAQGIRGASRAGSILRAADQAGFLYSTEAAYGDAAVTMAKNSGQLAKWRTSLPLDVAASPICQSGPLAEHWLEKISGLAAK